MLGRVSAHMHAGAAAPGRFETSGLGVEIDGDKLHKHDAADRKCAEFPTYNGKAVAR